MLRVGQMVDGRWRVVSPLPSGGELLRWFGRQPESGQPVEILRPRTLVPLRRRRAIVAGFRAARGDEAVVPILHVGDAGVIVREMPGERTLNDLDRPFTGADAIALAGWLGPAVRAMAPVLGGQLQKDEVVLDAQGRVLLAPGRRREIVAEQDQGSALQALGGLLYELLTGCAPESPPRSIRSLAPKTSDRVADMVMDLLSDDPATARAALPVRPQDAPVLAGTAVVRVEETGLASGALRTASLRPPYAVVIDPDSLGVVGRQRFSEAMGVPPSAFDDFAWARLPLPVASAQSAEDAAIWREEIARFRVDAWVVHRDRRFEGAWLVQASPLLAGAAIALVLGVTPLAGLAALGAAALVVGRMLREAGERHNVDQAYAKLTSYDDARGVPMTDLLASEVAESEPLSHDLSSIHASVGGREEIRSALRDVLVRRRTSGASRAAGTAPPSGG